MYGRNHVPEPTRSLARMHFDVGARKLTTASHEPLIGVLDQSDLVAQNIRTSSFIPGCKTDADGLGSCTANSTMAALSRVLSSQAFFGLPATMGYSSALPAITGVDDVAGIERYAIGFYHADTDQTGDLTTEWPPTDCGSSGADVVTELERLRLISTDLVAAGANNLVSLLQNDGVMMGSPFFNSWEQPDTLGFIDGNGSVEALQRAIRSGLAGGHETYISAVEQIALTETGLVIPNKTVLRVRNSWSETWGDHGSFRVHLSTLVNLGSACDYRQLVAA
jgi:hypothetical protein